MLLTMIARLADGLPLAASMQEDEQVKKATKHELYCQWGRQPSHSYHGSLRYSFKATDSVESLKQILPPQW